MESLQQKIKSSLHYNRDTGLFIWKKVSKYSNSTKVGDIAGTIDCHGYIRIHIDGKYIKAHRLAWFFEHGYFPNKSIDHINHNKRDNRICNLRDVSTLENNRNKSITSKSKTGVHGVRFIKSRNKYKANIVVNKKEVFLGYYLNVEDAIIARKNAEKQYGFHKNHGK